MPSGKVVYKRWGHQEDQLAYAKLIDLLKEYGLTMEQFLIKKPSSDKDVREIIAFLAKEYNWTRSYPQLHQRFVRMCSNQTISVRERKMLVRLVKKQARAGEINFEALQPTFPGTVVKIQ